MNLPVSARRMPDQRARQARPNDWMLAQLPVGMQDDDFLMRFVRIFQDVADGLLVHADALPHLADLTVTPTPMVRWLGHWIGNDAIDERMDDVLQRALVDVFGASLQWRGTRRGLRQLLELLVGPGVEIEDTGGIHREDVDGGSGGHVNVTSSTSSSFVTDQDLAALIRAEVPASVTLAVHVNGQLIYSDRRETIDR